MRQVIAFWLLMVALFISGLVCGLVRADSIDCDKAVREQTGAPGKGVYNVCIEVPKNYNKHVDVTSSVCEDGYGCHPIDAEGNIDRSKWWTVEPTGEPA